MWWTAPIPGWMVKGTPLYGADGFSFDPSTKILKVKQYNECAGENVTNIDFSSLGGSGGGGGSSYVFGSFSNGEA